MVSKLIEFLWRHRFQDVDLLLDQPLNRVDAAKLLGGAQKVVTIERARSGIEFVQKLLEPQLVDLMDDDEEHLVVMRRLRKRLLKLQQVSDFQI